MLSTMSSSRAKIPFDLLLAIVITVASGFLTFSTYYSLTAEREEHPRGTFDLLRGDKQFDVRSKLGCAGQIHTFANIEDSLTVVRIEGNFDVELYGQVHSTTLIGRMFFNPLGQLGLGYISLESAGRRVSIDAKDVSPIQIVFKVEQRGKDNSIWNVLREQRIIIPGPLEVKERGSTLFRFHYPLVENQLPALPVVNLSSLGMTLSEAQSQSCEQRHALPLSEIASGIIQQLPKIPGI